MKTSLFLILSILLLTDLLSQDSPLIVREGTEWITKYDVKNNFDRDHSITDSLFYRYYIEGDTLIGGQLWKKVYTQNITRNGPAFFHAAIREENQVVSRYWPQGARILYDFKLQVGDTVTRFKDDLGFYYYNLVTGRDTVVFEDGILRTRISIGTWYGEGQADPFDEWITGIGSMRFGVTYPLCQESFNLRCHNELLNCFSEAGSIIYERFPAACEAKKVLDQIEFAPPGAEWIYSFLSLDSNTIPPSPVYGYHRIRYVEDVIRDAYDAKRLVWEKIYINEAQGLDTIYEIVGERFLTQFGDKIYLLNGDYPWGTWTLLYNFSENSGGSFRANGPFVSGQVQGSGPYSEHFVRVLENKDTLIGDSLILRKVQTETACLEFGISPPDTMGGFSTTFLDRIGSLDFLFHTEYYCPPKFEEPRYEEWQLRCYSDDEINLQFSEQNCGLITSTQTTRQQPIAVSLFPNPTKSSLSIQSPLKISKCLVYNSLGQLELSTPFNGTELKVQNLPAGFYILVAYVAYDQANKHLFSKPFIKK